MSEEKNEWETRREKATETWANMTEHQRDCVLTMLKSWVPIRSRVSELCPISYEDIRALDDAWWGLKNSIVDREVQLKEWDF